MPFQPRDPTDSPVPASEKRFADYKTDGHLWITLATGEYYPDILPLACELYAPVLTLFGQLLKSATSSTDFFTNIAAVPEQRTRVQLARVFRKYVSPETPVEMLKKKRSASQIIERFGPGFRVIVEVQKAFESRPIPDEAICALLWEYKDRGKKGYDLTEKLFQQLRECLPGFELQGPERAGKDILMGNLFPDYPKPDRPVDFIISEFGKPLAVGLARYDSDRGGAQEDDRTGQYRDCAHEILGYAGSKRLQTKVVFVNDGPGLLLGTMWNDYASIEDRWPGRVKVVTLRMVPERITADWLRSGPEKDDGHGHPKKTQNRARRRRKR